MDPAALYPYVVPSSYLAVHPKGPDGYSRPLGHGLHVVLVVDRGNMVSSVSPEDIAAMGLGVASAHERAIANLQALARDEELPFLSGRGEPTIDRFIVVSGHWAAATCILLPGLARFIRDALEVDRLVASIPHRDALLMFEDADAAKRTAIRAFVQRMEGDGAKPLTFELFRLDDAGPSPI